MLDALRSVLRFREFKTDPVERRLSRVANVEDLRQLARRRLPGGVFDYIDGAAEDEVTLGRNTAGFDELEFAPRVLRDVSGIDTSTDILGQASPLPLILAPTGFGRIAHSEGELAVCRSASRARLPYTLSTMATRSIEEITEAQDSVQLGNDGDEVTSSRRWFQVYVWKDKGLLKELLDRAKEAGYESIMITVDTAVLGRRERDVRRGFTLPPSLGLDTLIDGALHPSWTWDFATADPIRFANVVGSDTDDGSDPISLSEHMRRQFDERLSWSDIEWFQSVWEGPIILKGIQTVDDALLAADAGVDAIALSNHGGRQLDGAPAPIDLVAPVVDAVEGRAEIYCDGGVRRGSDIVKAIALGADACMIGRAYFYALGAAGERGVDWVLEFLADGMEQTMALTGARSIDEIGPELVRSRGR
ncbi:MAG: alpha-hydroxy acid oxidase [Acidimicrobiales bacterium]